MNFSALSGVKVLGRTLGSVSSVGKPSDFDGDGDGFLTGPDGRDDVPAPAKFESLVDRVGAVTRFFRVPHESGVSEQINVVDDKGTVIKQFWVRKGDAQWGMNRKPVEAANGILGNLDEMERKFSKKYGDIREPKNMVKAIRSAFPNLDSSDEGLADLYPKRDVDGNVRSVDVGRIAMLLEGAERDRETAKRLTAISVSGKMVQGMFGGNMPGVFVYGAQTSGDSPFFAGLDFSPDEVPSSFASNHGWGLRVLAEMKESGFYSQDDVDKFYGAYIAAHEFGHAKHVMRALENDGLNLDAKSEGEFVANIRKMVSGRSYSKYETDEELELSIGGRILINGSNENDKRYFGKSDAEKRAAAIRELMDDAESFYFQNFTRSNAVWDSLTDSERADISQRDEWNRVSGYASVNELEFVAETLAQGLMGYGDGYTPKHWAKMADWMKAKAAKNKSDLLRKFIKTKNPDFEGTATAMCDGFAGAKLDKEKPGAKTVDFSSIISIKIAE